jgi:hypothetical protein
MDSNAWLPNEGLSEMQCIQASVAMARFCILICSDPEKSIAEQDEAKAIFAHVADLSSRPEQLEEVMAIDLHIAGMDEETAREWAHELSAQEYMEEIASMLVTHDPKKGLIRRKRFTAYFEDAKLVKYLIKVGNS